MYLPVAQGRLPIMNCIKRDGAKTKNKEPRLGNEERGFRVRVNVRPRARPLALGSGLGLNCVRMCAPPSPFPVSLSVSLSVSQLMVSVISL